MTIFMLFSGTVLRGLRLAKKLGWPTLNLSLSRVPQSLHFGVYAVSVKTPIGFFHGVAYFGPRLVHKESTVFEVHCFGLKKKLYGVKITVEIKKRIRGVVHFATIAALKKTVAKDILRAKKILNPKV